MFCVIEILRNISIDDVDLIRISIWNQNILSYMELIEVAFVAFFRNLGLSLQRIRSTRAYAAQNLNAEYPFVEYRWKSEGTHLLMDFARSEQPDDFSMVVVADAGGQLA